MANKLIYQNFVDEHFTDCKRHIWLDISLADVFDVEDNYEVERILRNAGVIHHNNQTDTESSALVVNFSSKNSALKFIDRYNTFMEKREVALKNVLEGKL